MRRFVPIALLLTACAPSAGGTTTTDLVGEEVRVQSVTDGDTFEIPGDKVRLIGINAPEWNECWGEQSTAALEALLGNTAVLNFDIEERDAYGRLLAYVWSPSGTFVNEAMVDEGHALARSYEPNVAMQDVLDAAEAEAEEAGAGLWGKCTAPETTSVRIAGFEADPPGPDGDDLNGEWIRLSNTGDGPIDLEGWGIRDESTSNRFTFDPIILEPGATITVFTGCGAETATELYWCSENPVWNNGGDTIFLLDASGLTVDMVSYGS